ncbi:MAG TPA: PQQ-dependent sugar dehydrogenase [Gemmatimonadales bacterium]|nr:PQQ-dependent sugar dehydrogenase [Gemmatimonadales bacterium]
MSKRLASVALFALACGGSATVGGQTPPEGMVAQPVAGHTLYLRPGFKINVFATADGVRNLVLGPGGAVYAALQGPGRVIKIAHADGDSVAGATSDAATGLNGPFGIAFRGDTMYVGEMTRVTRFAPGSTTGQTIVDGLPSGGHSTRTVVFGPDGLMYVAVGSSCNICDESNPRRAAVTRFNADGSGEHRFATGLRNSVGLAFNPSTGELWATNNDRDNLGDDLPPEHLNILKDGKFYGWPKCYLPGKQNPEYASADCSTVEPPTITFQAHSAPLGITFYTGSAFPGYKGDAFLTYHGSWNRSIPTGAKVVHVKVQNGKAASIEDFVTGWQLPDGSRWGRPVAVLALPDGSVLISDDQGGRIWRVTYGK